MCSSLYTHAVFLSSITPITLVYFLCVQTHVPLNSFVRIVQCHYRGIVTLLIHRFCFFFKASAPPK